MSELELIATDDQRKNPESDLIQSHQNKSRRSRNLTEYLKIGLGLDLVIEGSLYLNGKINSVFSFSEEGIRVAREFGLDGAVRFYEKIHNSMPNFYDRGASVVFIVSGGALLASGIYQLAKRVKTES